MSRAPSAAVDLQSSLLNQATMPTSAPVDVPAMTPAPLQQRVSNPSERIYGSVCIGTDAVLDIIDEYADVAGTRCHVTRVDERGAQFVMQPTEVATFDLARLTEPGEYRVRIQGAGQRSPLKCFRFRISGAASRPAETPAQLPAAPSPAGESAGMLAIAMQMMQQANALTMSMMQQSMAAQTAMMQKMMEQKSEQPGLGQLEGLIKIADRIASNRGEEEGGGMGQYLAPLLAGLLQPRPAAAPQPTQPPQRPQQALPANEPRALAAAGSVPAAQTSVAPLEQPVNSRDTSASPAGSQTPTPPAPSAADDAAARLTRMGEYLTWICASESRDPERAAETVADILGDDVAEKIVDLAAGLVVDQVILSNPALEPHRAFLFEVETELRTLYEEQPAAVAGQIPEPAKES